MRIRVQEGLRCYIFHQLPDAGGADPRTLLWVARTCLCDDGELPAARFVSSEATSHTWHLELAEEAHWSRRWCFHVERYYQGPAFTHCWQVFQFWGVAWSLDGNVLKNFFFSYDLKFLVNARQSKKSITEREIGSHSTLCIMSVSWHSAPSRQISLLWKASRPGSKHTQP